MARAFKKTTFLDSAKKFYTVTYTNEHSAGKSSYNDLLITCAQGVVGCGNKRFGKAEMGDVVLVQASHGKGKAQRKVFCIGILGGQIPECHEWFSKGGEIWPYNYEFLPITPIITRDEAFMSEIGLACEKTGVKHTCIFNSRFASEKSLKPLLTYMFKNDKIAML
jgi:hypothetical protein